MTGMTGTARIDLHVHTRHSTTRRLRCRRCCSGAATVAWAWWPSPTTTAYAVASKPGKGPTDFPVIVGEEIKSSKGDIIGLFLEQPVPPRLSPSETVKRVKAQGGLVGVPHPFDRIRPTAMGRRALLEILPWVDFLEGYNAHTMLSVDNRRGVDFAEEYSLPVVACSDSHSALELGRTYTEVPGEELDGTPEGLMRGIRAGMCVGRRPNPLLLITPAYAKLRKFLG